MATGSNYGTWEWLRARRVGLGPVYAAVVVLALGVTLHLLDGGPAWLLLGAYAVGVEFWARRALGWRRPYFAGAGAVSVLWLLWAHLAQASVNSWIWLLCSLSFATVFSAIPWWSDNVRRTHVKMEMVVKNWRVRAARANVGNSWLSDLKISDIGWTGKLNWRPGEYEVDSVASARGKIEGALGLQVGQLRMPLDGKSTSSINLVAVLKDPHAAAVRWEIPHTEVDGQLVVKQGSIKDDIEIGVREDASKSRINLWKEGSGGLHVLVAGKNGSGKSGLLNLLWAVLALCTDVVQWGVDLKGGVELGAWRKCFDWVVDTREDAIEMLKTLNAEMERRFQAMAEHTRTTGKVRRVWVPTPEDPVIVLSMDEAASVLGDASTKELKLAEDIARKGRAAGIILILATQYPTLEAIGTSQIREQIHYGFVFRMQTSKGETFVVPDGRVDAHKIDSNRPGTCYVQAGAELDKMPIRVYFLDDEGVEEISDLAAGLGAVLAEEVETYLAGLVPAYAERDCESETERDESETRDETGSETVHEWNESENETIGDLATRRDETLSEIEQKQLARDRDSDNAEPARLDEEPAREALIAALRDAGPDGMQAKDLMVVCTRRSTWLYDRLGELSEEGRATRTRTGRWSWIGQDSHAV